MRWTGVLIALSAVCLGAAEVTRAYGNPTASGWLLLGWTVLLPALAWALLNQPMHTPAWGLFAAFWGLLAMVTLLVLQALAVAAVLRPPARALAETWPLAVVAVWILVVSALGLGQDRDRPAAFHLEGILVAGAGLLVCACVWAAAPVPAAVAAVVAVAAYVAWAGWLSVLLWMPLPARDRRPDRLPLTAI